jgi:hypothetical protein
MPHLTYLLSIRQKWDLVSNLASTAKQRDVESFTLLVPNSHWSYHYLEYFLLGVFMTHLDGVYSAK